MGARRSINLLGALLGTGCKETSMCPLTRRRVSGCPFFDANWMHVWVRARRSINPEHFGALALPVAELLALGHNIEYTG